MGEYRILPRLIRLIDVHGFEGRSNDIVYCRPFVCNKQSNLIVYFGGDVQDFIENMNSHRDNKRYVEWNLENIACLLRSRFLDSHIIVVRPSSMKFKTFSCFRNFVPSNNFGVPEHKSNYEGLCHLEALIGATTKRLRSMTDDEIKVAVDISKAAVFLDEKTGQIWKSEEIIDADNVLRDLVDLTVCNLKLIGFSKGCVVLNQFLHEFNHYKELESAMDMITRIKSMYWLDGGHNGGSNTWITSKPILKTLTQLGISVHIHVSPYQICDDRRPWIRKEEKAFYDTLLKLSSPVQQTVHFENAPPDLNLHFEVLKVFAAS